MSMGDHTHACTLHVRMYTYVGARVQACMCAASRPREPAQLAALLERIAAEIEAEHTRKRGEFNDRFQFRADPPAPGETAALP